MCNLKKIYCGGRFYFDCRDENYTAIAKLDYRSKLLGNVETLLSGCNEISINSNTVYIGPYYFETIDMKAKDIIRIELSMIECCTDAIFVFDTADCPGTITELIYAATKGKKIHIFYKEYAEHDETESDLHTPCWFPIHAAQALTNISLYKYKDYNTLSEIITEKIFQ